MRWGKTGFIVIIAIVGWLVAAALVLARSSEPEWDSVNSVEEVYREGGSAHKQFEDQYKGFVGKLSLTDDPASARREAQRTSYRAHKDALAITEDYEMEMMRLRSDDAPLIEFIIGRQAERTAVALVAITDFISGPNVDLRVLTAAPSPSSIATAVPLTPSASFVSPATSDGTSTPVANVASGDLIDRTSPTVVVHPPTAAPSVEPTPYNAIAELIENAASSRGTTYEDIFSGSYTPSPSDEPPSMIIAKGVIFDCWVLQEWYAEEKSYSHLADTMSWYFDIAERRNNFNTEEAKFALNECGGPVR